LDRADDQAWIAAAIGLQSRRADVSPPALFLQIYIVRKPQFLNPLEREIARLGS
jgi:hypothetical protein